MRSQPSYYQVFVVVIDVVVIVVTVIDVHVWLFLW